MLHAKRIYFKEIVQEGEIKFGYIYVEEDGHIQALHQLLLNDGSAVVCSDADFEESKLLTV